MGMGRLAWMPRPENENECAPQVNEKYSRRNVRMSLMRRQCVLFLNVLRASCIQRCVTAMEVTWSSPVRVGDCRANAQSCRTHLLVKASYVARPPHDLRATTTRISSLWMQTEDASAKRKEPSSCRRQYASNRCFSNRGEYLYEKQSVKQKKRFDGVHHQTFPF